jgi:uncharacterized protein (DUF983 family)
MQRVRTAPAIFLGLCPRCRRGKIFSSLVHMNDHCNACELIFEREAGYFLGAMIFSYAISLALYALIYILLKEATREKIHGIIVLEMFLIYLPFVPLVFRYSRILWIYLDQRIDPTP